VARGQPKEMKKAPTGPKNSNPFVLGFRVDWGGLVGIELDEVGAKSGIDQEQEMVVAGNQILYAFKSQYGIHHRIGIV